MEENKKDPENLEDDDDLLDIDDIDDTLDEEDDEKDEKGKEDDKSKEEQEKAERARQAKARREREAREREAREKEIHDKALLEGELNATKVNTFTNKPIKDEYDLKIYKLQKAIEDEGGDPIADLPEKLAKLDREQGAKKKQENEAKKEKDDIISNDIKDFRAKYPDVNVRELLADPDFKDYTYGRLGIKGGLSLAQLYDSFNKFKSKYHKDEKENEEGEKSKKDTPPSPNGGRKQEKTSYSKMGEKDRINYLKKQGLIN